jgi:hypothetical protein
LRHATEASGAARLSIVDPTPYRTNAYPRALPPEPHKDRVDVWLEVLRFVGELVLGFVALHW